MRLSLLLGLLQQAEGGTPVPEVCRKMGVSEATFYRWKQKYGGLVPSEVKRLRSLEEDLGVVRRAANQAQGMSLSADDPTDGS